MKSKSKISKKSKSEQPHREASSTTRERRFWAMRVEPMERIAIAENITTCLMVIQNHGPGKIGVHAYGDQVELMPGKMRVIRAIDHIHVESKDENSALIELEFMPTQISTRPY
jgi:hypothetical protein